ncbi:MAG: FAD-binding oxidoreductase [Pseudomonadota bacterium]
MTAKFDILIIGGGIAGASVAYELAADAKVAILEMESQPGYHTTGRSAATYSELYGPPPIRALTSYSRDFFENPPEVFGDDPLLMPRGVLYIARSDQRDSLADLQRTMAGKPGVRKLDAVEARKTMPLLRPGHAAGGLFESGARDIDVNALHQGFLRGFRQRGGTVVTHAEVTGMERVGGVWTLITRNGVFAAPVVVNAAGAWADEIAVIAGVKSIGLVPKRRTAMIVAAPEGSEPQEWPVALDVDEQFYIKPDAGRLLMSPADETPSAPCDAQPEEIDIAICIERIHEAFDLDIKRVENAWAGLRSFVGDHAPVCGYDPETEGFFWLAGQGGYGIQSSPGLSLLAARLVTGEPVPEGLEALGFSVDQVSPERLRRA